MSYEDNGLHCPQCNTIIKFTLNELLFKNKITCPGCFLELRMEVPETLKTSLQEIQQAQDMATLARDAEDMPTSSNPNASFGELNLDGIKLIPMLKE